MQDDEQYSKGTDPLHLISKIDSSRNKGGNKMYIEGYQDGLIEAKSIISEQLD